MCRRKISKIRTCRRNKSRTRRWRRNKSKGKRSRIIRLNEHQNERRRSRTGEGSMRGERKEQEKRPYRTEAGRIQGAGAGPRKEEDLVEIGVRRFSLKDR
jgi:hypothetical protein